MTTGKFCKCNQTIKESWGTEKREGINYCLFCDLINETKITVSQEMDSDNEVYEYKHSLNKSIKGSWKPNILGVFAIIAPLIFAAGVLNIVFSNFHLSALLTHVEITEDIMKETNNRSLQLNIVENSGGNCIRVGIVGRSYCGINEWDSLIRDNLTEIIQEGKADLEFQDFMMEDSQQFPFGGKFNVPKEAYHKHIKAWIDYYSRLGACQDWNCFRAEWGKPNQIKSTFKIAHSTFLDVVPLVDFKDNKVRIAEIFAN